MKANETSNRCCYCNKVHLRLIISTNYHKFDTSFTTVQHFCCSTYFPEGVNQSFLSERSELLVTVSFSAVIALFTHR